MIENYLTPAQAAAHVGISRATIYRRIKSGELPAAKAHGILAIKRGDLLKWSEAYRQQEGKRRPSKARAKKKELSPTRARAMSLAQKLQRRRNEQRK